MFKKIAILLIFFLIIFGLTLSFLRNFKYSSLLKNFPDFNSTNFTNFTNRKPKSPETIIILTGDIMLGRSVMSISLKKNNPNYPFEKVSDILKQADVVFGNLENPVIKDCPLSDSGLIFCADPKMLQGLTYAGINIVNIANNHIQNYGLDGLAQTENYLKSNGIDYVGTGNLVIKNINNTRFGFLGFNFIDSKPSDQEYQLIKDAKKEVNVLIVMTHWGTEYASEPTTNQKLIAENLIEAGADMIVGNHSHWVQSIDYINNKPVFYSLGNFVFDQTWSEKTKNGLVIRLTYQGNKLLKIEKLPVYMRNFAQPEWVN